MLKILKYLAIYTLITLANFSYASHPLVEFKNALLPLLKPEVGEVWQATKDDLLDGTLDTAIKLIDQFGNNSRDMEVEKYIEKALSYKQLYFQQNGIDAKRDNIFTASGIQNLREQANKIHNDIIRLRREAFRKGATLEQLIDTRSKLRVHALKSDYQPWVQSFLAKSSKPDVSDALPQATQHKPNVSPQINDGGHFFRLLNYCFENEVELEELDISNDPDLKMILAKPSTVRAFLDNELINECGNDSGFLKSTQTKKQPGKKKKKKKKSQVSKAKNKKRTPSFEIEDFLEQEEVLESKQTVIDFELTPVSFLPGFDRDFFHLSFTHPSLKKWYAPLPERQAIDFEDEVAKKQADLKQKQLEKQWLEHQAIYFLSLFSSGNYFELRDNYFLTPQSHPHIFLAQAVIKQNGDISKPGLVKLVKDDENDLWTYAKFEEYTSANLPDLIDLLKKQPEKSTPEVEEEEVFLTFKYNMKIIENALIEMSVPGGKIILFPREK